MARLRGHDDVDWVSRQLQDLRRSLRELSVAPARGGVTLGLLVDEDQSTWWQTTSAPMTTVGSCTFARTRTGISWLITVVADAGTTVQAQLLLDGVPIATSPVVVAGSSDWADTFDFPPGSVAGDQALLEVQAQVLTGAGAAHLAVRQLSGVRR